MAKVLIVDDDVEFVDTIELLLAEEDYEISRAYNREQGMAQVKQVKPDLIVLDVIMEQPDDGITMAQELRRQGFRKPILMLTGVGKTTGMTIGKDNEVVPVDDFLEKPVEPQVLVKRIRELLKKAEG